MQDNAGLKGDAGDGAVRTSLRYEDIEFNLASRTVRRGFRPVRMGPTERKLLETFMTNIDRVMTRQELIDRVWSGRAEIDERTIDVHVGRLRKALNRGRDRDPVRTVRGIGYAFGRSRADG